MQLAVGTVIDGKVVLEGDPLPEGAVVTILAREADETFLAELEKQAMELPLPERAKLIAALRESRNSSHD